MNWEDHIYSSYLQVTEKCLPQDLVTRNLSTLARAAAVVLSIISHLISLGLTVRLRLSSNRMCTGSIRLLVSNVRRTRAPVNLPTAWGKVKEGGRRLGKIVSLSLTPLFTATWKKRSFSLLLIRWTLVREENNDTCVHGTHRRLSVHVPPRQWLLNACLWSPYAHLLFLYE